MPTQKKYERLTHLPVLLILFSNVAEPLHPGRLFVGKTVSIKFHPEKKEKQNAGSYLFSDTMMLLLFLGMLQANY